MKKIFALFLTGLALIVSRAVAEEKVLAQVGSASITLDEFQSIINAAPANMRPNLLQQKEKLLQELVNEELMYQEGLAMKLAEDKTVLQAVERAKKQIIIQRLLQTRVQESVKVSPEEVKEFFDKNPDKFIVPERVRAAHILVKDESLAKDLLDKINKGTDFGALAAEHSLDPSKVNGGDLGFFARGQMVPEFEKAAFDLPEGGVSGVVKTQYGMHIVKCLKKEPSKPMEFGEVKEALSAQLLGNRQQEEVGKILDGLAKKTAVQTHPELLGEVK